MTKTEKEKFLQMENIGVWEFANVQIKCFDNDGKVIVVYPDKTVHRLSYDFSENNEAFFVKIKGKRYYFWESTKYKPNKFPMERCCRII